MLTPNGLIVMGQLYCHNGRANYKGRCLLRQAAPSVGAKHGLAQMGWGVSATPSPAFRPSYNVVYTSTVKTTPYNLLILPDPKYFPLKLQSPAFKPLITSTFPLKVTNTLPLPFIPFQFSFFVRFSAVMQIKISLARLYTETLSNLRQVFITKKKAEAVMVFVPVREVAFVLVSDHIHLKHNRTNCFIQPQIVSVLDAEDEAIEAANDSNQ